MGPMENLDRRISASTDQLDTLKREKRANKMWNENNNNHHRSSSRPAAGGGSRPRSVMSKKSPLEDEVTFRINGEKMSKSKYFFGSSSGNKKQAHKSAESNNNPSETKKKKTAVDIFLEDKGPYSRKLYGPPPSKTSDENSNSNHSSEDKTRAKRARSQEQLEVSTECGVKITIT